MRLSRTAFSQVIQGRPCGLFLSYRVNAVTMLPFCIVMHSSRAECTNGKRCCFFYNGVRTTVITQLLYGALSGTTQVSWYQKKHSPTHTYPDQSSFICFLHLLRSIASSIPPCLIYVPDSFLHNLSPSPLWSTTWSGTLHFILHTFLHLIIVFFSQYMLISTQPVLLP